MNQWKPAFSPLWTIFASDVSSSWIQQHTSYPRPQLVRGCSRTVTSADSSSPDCTLWKSLNGLWEFDYYNASTGATRNSGNAGKGKDNAEESQKLLLLEWNEHPFLEDIDGPQSPLLPHTILVPFPIESPLSGIRQLANTLWYRKLFQNDQVASELLGGGCLKHYSNHNDAIGTMPMVDTDHRILVHVEASDWNTTLFVNRQYVGSHVGGYDPIVWDITNHILPKNGTIELLLRVDDPTDEGSFNAYGKQRRSSFGNPGGMVYTPTSGIWSTIWTECVPSAGYIGDLLMDTSEPDTAVRVQVQVEKIINASKHGQYAIRNSGHWSVRGTMFESNSKLSDGNNDKFADVLPLGDTVVANATAAFINGTGTLVFAPPKPEGFKLWSPRRPYLYPLMIDLLWIMDDVTANSTTKPIVVDSVTSYVGVRTIAVGQVRQNNNTTVALPLLNGKPIFHMATLDQGFTPDGDYAYATDDAWVSDIVAHRHMGFNTVRKHVKMEPRRWYYHTDRLGLMVWQDVPSRFDINFSTSTAYDLWQQEAARNIQARRNAPSIVQWNIYNEGWGQHASDPAWTQKTVDMVLSLDSSRLVNDASGGHNMCHNPRNINNAQNHAYHGTGEDDDDYWVGGCFGNVTDVHHYPQADFRGHQGCNVSQHDTYNKTLVLGEYGGTLLVPIGHEWKTRACHGNPAVASRDELADLFDTYADQLIELVDAVGLSGAVYTQLYDVETECNGLLTYDRIYKIDPERIAASNGKVMSHYFQRYCCHSNDDDGQHWSASQQ